MLLMCESVYSSLANNRHLLIEQCDFIDADNTVFQHHRTTGAINRLSHIQSYIAYYGHILLGTITFSRPSARWSKDIDVVEISRICFTPYKKNTKLRRILYNFPSLFVEQCCNGVAQEVPVDMFVTYTHEDESGKYLEHCGFRQDGLVRHSKNSTGWNSRAGRAKSDLKTKKRFIRDNSWQIMVNTKELN